MQHNTMSKKTSIQFLIEKITTLEFSIKNLPDSKFSESYEYIFEVNPASAVDIPARTIDFITHIGIYSDTTKTKNICELITSVKYGIKNLDQFIDEKDENLLHLPDQFMQTLLSISLSTSRGILAAKTEGTILNNVYLPVLNPTQFAHTDKIENKVEQ